jgi:S-(hydroxymethyl)glutathione dehydrogenase/alcohol dehydrogenase
MRAVVLHSTRSVRVENVPDPRIEHPRDVLVRVTSASICGCDLSVYHGASTRPLGHELVGVVEELGPQVRNLRRGDRVVVPFEGACGTCWFCERGFTPHCTAPKVRTTCGQAQLARVPHADFGPRRILGVSDEQALMLCDVLPAAYAGLRWAQLQPGETVAVWGCGAIGLMALRLARALGAAQLIGVDVLPERLELVRRTSGAVAVDASSSDAVETIRQLTGGRGADVGIEASDAPAQPSLKEKISSALHMQHSDPAVEHVIASVRRAGRVSLLGAHGSSSEGLPLKVVHEKGLRVHAGHAPVHGYIDELMEMVRAGRVSVDDVITHRLPLERAPHAYELCSRRQDGCVKVALNPWG